MTTEVNVAAGYGADSGELNATELTQLGTRLSRYGKEAIRFTVAGVLGWRRAPSKALSLPVH